MAHKSKTSPEAKREAWKDLKGRLERKDWNGLNPTTKVVPNKKRVKETRKAKHKGRKLDPFFVAA